MFRSLRLRMALSHAAVITVVLSVIGLAGYLAIARSLDRAVTNSLVSAASGEVDRIVESGRIVDPPDSDLPSAAQTRVAVFTMSGDVHGESADVPSWLRPQKERIVTTTASRERLRIVTMTASLNGTPAALVVAGRSLSSQDDLLSELRWLLLLGGAAAVALAFGLGWVLAFAAAEPIRRAYEAQERFAADASHELRTPLAFLQSGLEMTAERDPELGGELLAEVSYLTDLTKRLLVLARADDRARVELQPEPLAPLCRASVERATRTLSVAVDVRCSEDLAGQVDPTLFEAALDALLENVAVHGGRRATLTCEAADAGHVVIAVADHGMGIETSLRARVLEPFFRVDPARSREHGGAGLGLSLAAKLIRAQGGTLSLSETPGGGLTATISLSRARVPTGRASPRFRRDQ
jgi:signal transduction histidine kinase